MFSKSCEHAIKAMIFMAQKSNNETRIGIKVIAKGTDVLEHFVAKIIKNLSKRKLIHSVKGPNGGFYMDKKALLRATFRAKGCMINQFLLKAL